MYDSWEIRLLLSEHTFQRITHQYELHFIEFRIKEILSLKGYNVETIVLYGSNLSIAGLGKMPTRDDVENAIEQLT